VEAADGIMSITLSFIQLVSLLTTFPIAWPPIFVSLFAVGGAVTVLGQHLVKYVPFLSPVASSDFNFWYYVLHIILQLHYLSPCFL
jgi:hypothetical protein